MPGPSAGEAAAFTVSDKGAGVPCITLTDPPGVICSQDAVFAVPMATLADAEEEMCRVWVVAPPFRTLVNTTWGWSTEMVATDCALVPS